MTAVLVDIGNTAIKWSLLGQIEAGVRRCERSPEALLVQLAELSVPPLPVVIASVAGTEFEAVLAETLRGAGYLSVEFCSTPAEESGLVNSYPEPGRMGVDRWFAMLGVWQRGPGPWLVIDAGSAITCDLITSDGLHMGGYILPGPKLMEQALQRDTQRVRYRERVSPHLEPGRDTADCVVAGVWSAGVGAILQLVQKFPNHQVVITGGDAETLLSLGVPGEHQPDLVLQGLACRARQQSPGRTS